MELGPNGPIERRQPTGLPAGGRERMVLAKLTGAVDRLTFGEGRVLDGDTRLQALLGYTADPALWGVVLGQALARVERGDGGYARVVELARAARADEDVAATHLAWLLSRAGV